eukprot:1159412-Pelagomonas_calceolata.AAC.3
MCVRCKTAQLVARQQHPPASLGQAAEWRRAVVCRTSKVASDPAPEHPKPNDLGDCQALNLKILNSFPAQQLFLQCSFFNH